MLAQEERAETAEIVTQSRKVGLMFWRKKLRAREPDDQGSEAQTFFHGGIDGLRPGQIIIPRNKHPLWARINVSWQGVPAHELGDSGDTVSLTTDLEVAKGYAGEYLSPHGTRERGRVYEVRPLASMEIDPDWKWAFPTIARCKDGAEIVAVLDPVSIESDPRVLVKALARYYAYTETGAPVYDDEGYVIFTPELAQLGHTRQSLRNLGKWPEKHRYLRYVGPGQ